jgi:hypothetical protein
VTGRRNGSRRWTDRWGNRVAYGLVALAFALGLAFTQYRADQADEKIKAAAAERAVQLKAEADARAVGIERSRKDVIRRSCQESNRRHDATIEQLDKVIADLPPGRRARAEAGKKYTVALIDQLQPKRDCMARAERLIP